MYLGLSFKELRQIVKWGTFGKKGDQPLTWVPLCKLTTKHIKAILKTEYHVNEVSWLKKLFETELIYREAIKDFKEEVLTTLNENVTI